MPVHASRLGLEWRQLARRDRLDHLLLGLDLTLVVLLVAQHTEVPAHAAIDVDRDPGKDLLALLEAHALEVEVRQPDPVRGVGRVLTVVRRDRLGKALEVAGDLAVGAHACGQRSAAAEIPRRARWRAAPHAA